ncbi:zinc finger protein 185-like isoform X2 [Apus apus]|uniref:zinc finger protein 185-like isoform X2 n=1 Tax=Apus apus TaxID=8895 RepID=UPI0021F85DB3|nr:zinc finger protein 185-like isoform X2 [Apus apus]
MMSLGVSKGRAIPPTDEDRRRIIRQMKVRTTLKGDKSWIHHHNSDSEEEKKSSPLSRQAGGGSPASTPTAPQSDRSPASKPQPGYLIRGVFTRTIDKTPSVPDPSPSNDQKSTATKGLRSSSGYRMTTEDYKKLAPYNVRQKSVDLEEEDAPFSPDEHKKRTEAANSVLRSTASRERAYVLSAAKKSNGSPTQDFPPLFAKRIEIEEEEGQQRRSPTVSGSCRFTPDDNSTNGLRKNTSGSSWNEPKATAASPSSPETGSKSQTTTSLGTSSERISTSTETRNGDNRAAPSRRASSETVSPHGDGDKPLKEKPELFPWDGLAPRAAVVSRNGSYPEHTEANSGFYPPRDRPGEATDQLHETSGCLDDAKFEAARSSLLSDGPSPPAEQAPVHLENTEYSFKRSVLGYEERSSSQEGRHRSPGVPAHSKPCWSGEMSSQDFKEGNTPRERGHESTWASDDHKPELIRGLSDSTNHSEKGQEPPDHNVHPEPPRLKEHTEHESSMTRSSSPPRESSIPAPKTQHGDEPEPVWDRVTPACAEQTHPTPESHHESPGGWRLDEPRSNFSSTESVVGGYESPAQGRDRPPAPSHRIPSYLDSQVFSTRRPTPDYEGRGFDGRSSPRNSRYDSTSTWLHGELNPSAGRHDSLHRDTIMSISQRSHRVPFYMDSLNYNNNRLLSSSSERICSPGATFPHSSPAAPGYQPDSSTAGKGVLFVKEYVNSSGLPASLRYGSGSLVDLTNLERATYNHHSYLGSPALQRSSEPPCSYCGREIRDCPKIIIEHLNIYCHEYCFRCGICHKAMGDLLDKIFIHRDIVHCDKCYEKLF